MNKNALLVVLGISFFLFSQNLIGETIAAPFDHGKFDLRDLKAEKYTQHPDVVIADDKTEITYNAKYGVIERSVVYYVRSAKGVEALRTLALPECFDKGYSKLMLQQGRKDLNTGTEIDNFQVKEFVVRSYNGKVLKELKYDYRYKKRRWMQATGEILKDEIPEYTIDGITENAFVQIHYKATFEYDYGSNTFFFYDRFPKAHAVFQFNQYMDRKYDGGNYCIWFNVPDSSVKKQKQYGKDAVLTTVTFTLNNIDGVNYSQNIFKADALPHIVFDFDFYRLYQDLHHTSGTIEANNDLVRPKNFQWFDVADTNWVYEKTTYQVDRDLRKLMKRFPVVKNDSGVVNFLRAYRDTISAFRYLTKNHMFYNEEHLLNTKIYDHFERRRFHERAGYILSDMLYESGVMFYYGNIMDRRFGNHSPKTRAHFNYESRLVLVPEGNKYHFVLPRKSGVKYFMDELPFYFEGGVVALFPANLQKDDKTKISKFSNFIKLHQGSEADNIRVENAIFQISPNKKQIQYSGKLSLTGQYSTLLRHLYLRDPIDSTVSPFYFKKCTDKPGAANVQVKVTSKSKDYPFRHNIGCTEVLAMAVPNQIDFTGWFSFVINRQLLPELPTSNYYFDFAFNDVYNFELNFEDPVEIKNASEFLHNINNKCFEFSSEILTQAGGSYLVKVKFQVKTVGIKKEDMNLLEELLRTLDQVNSFKCQL